MHLLTASPEIPMAATDYSEEEHLAIRDFCIDGLAMAVPRFMSSDTAENLVMEWFPSDRLALAGLYRQISRNRPDIVA